MIVQETPDFVFDFDFKVEEEEEVVVETVQSPTFTLSEMSDTGLLEVSFDQKLKILNDLSQVTN